MSALSVNALLAVGGLLALLAILTTGLWLEYRQDRFRREFTRRHPLSGLMCRRNRAEREKLTWCQGCGCRHRTSWMAWTDEGRWRCRVCCGATHAVHPAAVVPESVEVFILPEALQAHSLPKPKPPEPEEPADERNP